MKRDYSKRDEWRGNDSKRDRDGWRAQRKEARKGKEVMRRKGEGE